MYIVSACLLGENCKYNGGNSRSQAVIEYLKGKDFIAVCPEEMGGFVTPRPPCEIWEGRVINKENKDVTQGFSRGAEAALEEARRRSSDGKITMAILKEQSPSCGSKRIYDGSFSGRKIKGQGWFTALLRENGIPVISEEEAEKFVKGTDSDDRF